MLFKYGWSFIQDDYIYKYYYQDLLIFELGYVIKFWVSVIINGYVGY